MLTTTSRAVTGATTRYQAPRRSGRSTAVFSLAQCPSPSGLFGGPAHDTDIRLDDRFDGRELVAAGAREVSQSHGVGLNNAHSVGPGKRGARKSRVRDPRTYVSADTAADRADHEGRVRADARAEPPPDGATPGRPEERENLGHGPASSLALTNSSRASLEGRRLVVPRRLTGGNAQRPPAGPAQRLGQVDDLTHVVARVCERAMQRFGNRERLRPNRHGALEIRVGEVGERREQDPPPLLPLGLEPGARDITGEELGVAVAPRLLAVGGEKVGEAGLQAAGNGADGGRDGIVAARGVCEPGGVGHLRHGALAEGPVWAGCALSNTGRVLGGERGG